MYSAGRQIYTVGKLYQVTKPLGKQFHMRFSYFCLKTQEELNAMTRPDFPSMIVKPDTPYRSLVSVTLSKKDAK